MNGQRIRAVFFDAVGTLLHPEPAAATVYAQVGRRHGSRLDASVIERRFRAAMARQDEVDRANEWRTCEQREVERWRTIVGEVLDDVADPAACFGELDRHFSEPRRWRCDAAAAEVIAELQRRGRVVGLASNFDHRLRAVIAGWPVLARLPHVLISAEIGWRKPAPQFYAALARSVALSPQEVAYVGDDRVNDYDGARASGFEAVLVGADGAADLRALLALVD